MKKPYLSVGRSVALNLTALTWLFAAFAGSAVAEGVPAGIVSQPSVLPTMPPAGDRSTSNENLSLPSDVVTGDIVTSQYLLGVGDQLQVSVFNAEDYSGEFSVLSGGVLNIPLIGEVLVEGLTPQQAAKEISDRLQEYVRRPRVTVSLLAARPLQVAIAGEVNRPGAYTLSAEGENGSATPTLTQAISQAGGITQSADIRQIVVQRQQSGAVASAANLNSEINVNLWQLLKDGQLDADLPLQRGDRILIPQATALSPEESVALASASFSPDEITVNVVGEVESPGAVLVPPNTPLNQALLTAGGFNRRARQSTVTLIRLNDNGSVAKQDIEVDFEAGINEDSNPPLRPNDTIVVRRNGLTRVTDTLGAVLSPINSGFGLFRLFGL
ncbi:MAG: polysaccharide biosynthesis/export family protein [Phormidesmis sp.]